MKLTTAVTVFFLLILTEVLHFPLYAHPLLWEMNLQINKNVINHQKEFSFFFAKSSFDNDAAPAIPSSAGGNSMNKAGQLQHSAFAAGDWYKIGLTQDGVYIINYNFLKTMGINPGNLTKKDIHIYGKPGGMLPEGTSIARDSDLVENAIFVSGDGNDKFGSNDYILFYGQGQWIWKYNNGNKHFQHIVNPYADTSYYFLTISSTPGKRMLTNPSLSGADRTITDYDEYAAHDNDQWTDITKNVMSGRQWWGEAFNSLLGTSKNFNFSFPNRDVSQPASIKGIFASRSLGANEFDLSVNNTNITTYPIGATSYEFTAPYATISDGHYTSFTNGQNDLNVNVSFRMPDNNSYGWLDYLEINVRSHLAFHNGQFGFRDAQTIDSGHINQFMISNANRNTQVWDVTDFHNVSYIDKSYDGNGNVSFSTKSGSLREFVVFDGTNFYQPSNFGRIGNQDIHGQPSPDMIIVSYPDFMLGANKIADFHRQKDNMKVLVISPRAIYNEFSGGAQDVTAIRDMDKMFYDRWVADKTQTKLQYVLLVGGTSYDAKNRVPNNTNYVVTYEDNEQDNSVSYTNSYCSDDYIGFVRPGQGYISTADSLDISVGRLPVTTSGQANDMADKIIRYADPRSMRDWRNIVTFVADDGEGNLFENSVESTTNAIKATYPCFNIHKIYLDAFKEKSTPAGLAYPDAEDAIVKRVQEGTLVINYTGHGGGAGWSHERVLQISDINGWTNTYAMPLFLTATCEFGRFDDPVSVSAGQLCILNPRGGAIALFTTTRLAESGGNDLLTNSVYQNNIFRRENGKPRRLGDIIRQAKNTSVFQQNTIIFALLGDPALQLVVPKDSVITSSVNGVTVTPGKNDTLKALTLVTIKGYIADDAGNKRTGFNGIITPTVYDKPETVTTLANNPWSPTNQTGSYKMNFSIQENIIYKGSATVKNGEFTFSFVMPRDVSYTHSMGKISYYATNKLNEDATGLYRNIIIGGTSKEPVTDNGEGPHIQLYINDTNFISGGLCNDTPLLLAKLKSKVGINTTGNSIGHDITGTLNNQDPIVLNSYYQADTDDYRGGWVKYPFDSLADGNYRLNLKAWDVQDNSAETYIDFVVISTRNFTIRKVFNYPNPFSDETTFSFQDNADPNQELKVEIEIYDVKGGHVKTILATPETGSSNNHDVHWNGRTDGGAPMAQGMYIYRLMVTTPDNQKSELSSRLVIIRP